LSSEVLVVREGAPLESHIELMKSVTVEILVYLLQLDVKS